MPYYPISKSQSDVFRNSGILLLLKLGGLANKLTPEFFPYEEDQKRDAILAEVRTIIGQLVFHFEEDQHGNASPLKPFITENHSPSINVQKLIIFSLMAYRLVHAGDTTLPINVIMAICSGIDPESTCALEYRRIIGVMAVEGLLELNDEDDTGIVVFLKLSEKCIIAICGGISCLPILDAQTIDSLQAEKSIKVNQILKSRFKKEYH